VDADIKDLADLGFLPTARDIASRLQVAAGVRVLILDACRDNPIPRRLLDASANARSAAIPRGLARPQQNSGTYIAFSTQPDQIAVDGDGRNSPFVAALLRHISEPGLDIRLLFADVRADVSRASQGAQVPEAWDSLNGRFSFKDAAPDRQLLSALPPTRPALMTNSEERVSETARRLKLDADLGDAAAQNGLALLYLHGRGGLPRDEVEAARLFKLASDQGYAQAQDNLGLFYEQGRGGLLEDDREAVRLYRLSAYQGYPGGQVHLGMLYEEGRGGLPTDDREAARLYKLAAEQGDAVAQNNLGVFYRDGRGGLKSDREAARLFKLSADQGSAVAQSNLLKLYLDARATSLPRDDRKRGLSGKP
jgi:hypothetical protein